MCNLEAAYIVITLLVLVVVLMVYDAITYRRSLRSNKPNPDDFKGLIPKDRGDGAGF